jgi:hypothetical protein
MGGEGDMLDDDDGEGAKMMVDSKTSESELAAFGIAMPAWPVHLYRW